MNMPSLFSYAEKEYFHKRYDASVTLHGLKAVASPYLYTKEGGVPLGKAEADGEARFSSSASKLRLSNRGVSVRIYKFLLLKTKLSKKDKLGIYGRLLECYINMNDYNNAHHFLLKIRTNPDAYIRYFPAALKTLIGLGKPPMS